MKKLAFLVVAGALALGACKKKDNTATTTPTGDMGNPAAYGGATYAAPTGGETTPEGNPCGGAANPCG